MSPTVTLAMIVKDEEENLAQCLDSVAKHVDEIVIVDTGSTDRTREVAIRYGANVYQFDRVNHPEAFFLDDKETGEKIGAPEPYSGDWAFADFGGARNESFKHATSDFIYWADADDVVEGAEHLHEVAADMQARGLDFGFMPYDYARDHLGRVFYRQWRERIVRRGSANWVNPVHEVLLPVRPVVPHRYDKVTNSHRRKADRKSIPNRNYKILLYDLWRNHAANPTAPVDPRALFYLGQESRFIDPLRAVGFYEEYLKLSGWGEERAAAHVALGSLYEFGMLKLPEAEAYQRANREYATAAAEMPDNPDGLFGLARIAYLRKRYQDCVTFSERAFAIGNTDSMLGANPMDRLYRPHAYYNHALACMGRLPEAIESCRAALKVCPDDPGVPGGASGMITLNLAVYEQQLRNQAPPQGQPALKAEFDKNEDVEAPPAPGIPRDALVIWAMQLWKQCVAINDGGRAWSILDGLPPDVAEDPAVARMRASTSRRFPEMRSALEIAKEALGLKAPKVEYRPMSATAGGEASLRVVFWLGPCFEPWDPTSPNTKGLGGSETACIEVAKNLVRLGHHVEVYAEPINGGGIFEGVTYRPYQEFQGCDCDVFTSSRAPGIMEYEEKIKARVKLLWVHDIHVGSPSPQMERWLMKFDRILCLSQWHKDYFLSVYPWVHAETVVVTRNGIDPARFSNVVPKVNDLIFSSSPNRGLDTLLVNFPFIRRAVPDAQLHIMYGFDCWETFAKQRGDAGELADIQRYKDLIDEAVKAGGVTWHGRMNQQTLADHFMRAKVLSYPTIFPETFCISALEAQAAGCVPVTSRYAALGETVKHGILIDPGPNYGQQWLDAVVKMLTDDSARVPLAEAGRTYALGLSWAALASEWESMFRRLAAELQADPLPRWRSA